MFVFLLILFLIFCLQIHNILLFPQTHGFDATGHIAYIRFLQTYHRIPLPFEGWELWQPPLYYVISSTLPSLKSAQFIGLFSWVVLLYSGYLLAKHLNRKKPNLQILLTLLTIPVLITLTPTISNELFSASLISLGLVLWIKYVSLPSIRTLCFTGIITGLAVLSKATAWILVATFFLDVFLIHRSKKMFVRLLVILTISLFISGWFYLKNLILFGSPFTASFDFSDIHPLTQTVVPRTFSFFTNLVPLIRMDLFQSHHVSFPVGTFFSWFYDGHNVIVPIQRFSKIGMVLILASLPIFVLSCVGVFRMIRSKNKNYQTLLIYSVLLMLSYIAYNFRLPFHSTVKGAFLVSASLPFAVSVGEGIQSNRVVNKIAPIISFCTQ